MQLKHASAAVSASFDDPNLVSTAGLVPMMALATKLGLRSLSDRFLTLSTDKGANAGLKVSSLVAGMLAGADSIDDMAVLRHGGIRKLFSRVLAPSTLGSFLRQFTFGHVRQLDAVASRFLTNLTAQTPLLPVTGDDAYVLVDIDDTIIEVHGHKKQGSGYGYSGVRGINALMATVTTTLSAPVVIGQRLRRGACYSANGAARMIRDVLATLHRMPNRAGERVLVRADSAYYGHAPISAAITAGAAVSVTVRMDPAIKRAIGTITEDTWETIHYTDAIYDEDTGQLISSAEVAEVAYTAFSSRKKADHVPGRLVVRRIPELNKTNLKHPTLFDTHRFHAFFTTNDLDTVTADKTHRQHAIIEQVHKDLKGSALAHLPSGKFNANAAWLVIAVIAFNLTRAAATLTGEHLAKAATATIRTKLINVPARIASSARRIRLHLPENWPWETEWTTLFRATTAPPGAPTI